MEFNLQPNEKILLSVRKHVLVLIGQLIPYAILDFLPHLFPWAFALIAARSAGAIDPTAFSLDSSWAHFILGIYWLFVWMGAFSVFTRYFLNEWVLTNERIVDIRQTGFFGREVSSLFLDRVQDASSEINGFFGTLFGFGTITVESAGAQPHHIEMTGLARPQYVRERILEEVATFHKTAAVTATLPAQPGF